jgi:hypothetical protein
LHSKSAGTARAVSEQSHNDAFTDDTALGQPSCAPLTTE